MANEVKQCICEQLMCIPGQVQIEHSMSEAGCRVRHSS